MDYSNNQVTQQIQKRFMNSEYCEGMKFIIMECTLRDYINYLISKYITIENYEKTKSFYY